MTLRRDILALAAFASMCAAVSGVGGAVTATSVGGWYQTLAKPAFNPPDWVFPPVWTTLFVCIAVAGWRAWRLPGPRFPAFAVYGLQLGLNLGWSVLFFGLQSPGLALAEIVPLLAAIAANMVLFWRIDRLAGLLMAPYLIWVAYATALNAAIWLLN